MVAKLEQATNKQKSCSILKERTRQRKYDRITKMIDAQSWFPEININHNVKVPDVVTQKVTEIAESLSQVWSGISWKSIFVSLLSCIRICYKHFDDKETVLLSIGSFVASLGLTEETLEYLKDIFVSSYQGIIDWYNAKRVSAHSVDEDDSFNLSDIVPYIGGPLVALLTAMILRKIPGGEKTGEFLNRYSKIGSCIKTTKDLSEFGNQLFEDVIEKVRVNVFGCDKKTYDEWESVNAWYGEVLKIIPNFEDNLRADSSLKTTVDVLFERGLNIVKMLDLTKTPQARRDHVNKMMMTLASFRDKASGVSAGQIALRVPPAIFHIFGDSGVGKSSILACLTADIQASLGVTDPKDITLLTYYRQPGRDFWDGYRNAVNLVVCDDFGAIVDSEQRPNEEFLEAIRMSNTADYMLNMADLKDKGQTHFNAKAVIWTSNRENFTCKSLTNYEAVMRRVSRKYRQKPAPGFSKIDVQNNKQVEILDQVKVAAKYGNLSIESIVECIVFDEVDKRSGSIIRPNLSYEEFSKTIVEEILSNKVYHDDFNTLVTSYAERAIAKYNSRRVQANIDFPCHHALTEVDFSGDVHTRAWNISEHLADGSSKLRKAACITVTNFEKFALIHADAVYTAYLEGNTEEQRDIIYDSIMQQCFPTCDAVVCNCLDNYDQDIVEQRMLQPTWKKCFIEIKETVMSWCTFNMLYAVLKGALGIASIYLISKAFKSLKNWFSCRRNSQIEAYDTSKTKGRKVRSVETYDTAQTKGVKTRTVEWFFSGPCEHDKQPGYCTICDKACEGGHGNLFNYCYLCDPTWYERLGISVTSELYDTSKTSGVKVRKVEMYDTNTTKGVKVRSVEQYDTSSTKGVKVRKVEADPIEQYTAKVAPSEAVLDPNAADIVTKMYRNMYKLEYKKADGTWQHALNMLIVKGRLAITNRHVLGMKAFSEWRIRNTHKPDGYPIDLWKLNQALIPDDNKHGHKDVMMFELPRVVEQHPDITSKFMTGADFSRFQSLKTVSLVGYVPSNEIVLRQYFSDLIRAVDEPIEFAAPAYTSYCRQYFEYGIQSTFGDCGGVLVAFDNLFNNKIFGIHAGGDKGSQYCGLGTPISQQVLSELEKNLVCQIDSKLYPSYSVDSEVQVVANDKGSYFDWSIKLPFVGNFNYFGSVAKRVFAASDSAITPSPVFGVIAEPTMKPAHLKPFYSNGVLVDPMAKARVKASPAPVLMNIELLDSSVNHFTQLVTSDVNEIDRRVLSYEEAIAGIHGDEFYAGLNRSTSPGYGWVKSGKGKTKWLGSEDEYDVSNVELRNAYDSLLLKCKVNRPSVIWQDTLKDERRPIAKVDAGKTRLFSVGEMSYTVAFRQYFLGFIAHMMRHRIDFESCVGVNCYSSDWTKLARVLKQMGPKVIAGDFGNYDGTLNAELLWRVLDVIESFYQGSDEEKFIRRSLWSEVVNSLHISGDTIYGWTHSQPSGCPMTTILNCCYHSISARYVFLVCALKYKPEMASLDNFTKYVRHINYGDDDVWNLSDEIISWFNQITITEAYATFGMEYTDEAKTGNIVAYRSLDEINFLKRTFRWDNVQMRYRAPLALETVREMAMWNRKTSDVYQLTRDVLQDAVVELAQHSEEVFNRELPNFEKARLIITKREPCYFGTYADYQRVEFNKYCIAVDQCNSE